MDRTQERLYPALLKFWRQRRGLSQLDLALEAEISARHLSFLETGRAHPSREMVLRLGAALDLPLRDRNTMLNAAGFETAFEELNLDAGLPQELELVLGRMLAQHEPFPLVISGRSYDILRANAGAQRLFARIVAEPAALVPPLNLLHMLFDTRLARGALLNWESVARSMLARVHRERLARPHDEAIAHLADSLCAYPGVPRDWRQPDFSQPSEPALVLRLRRAGLEANFLATVTTFNAPQNVTLEELRIDSCFALDEQTAETCARLAREA
jgi:transcriptional regulator with XRE-family HTH domain